MTDCVELIDGWYWHDGPALHGPFPSQDKARELALRVGALRVEIERLLAGVYYVL